MLPPLALLRPSLRLECLLCLPISMKFYTCFKVHIKYFFLHENFTKSLILLCSLLNLLVFHQHSELWQWFSIFFPSQYFPQNHDVSSHMMAHGNITLTFPWLSLFWNLYFYSIYVLYLYFIQLFMSTASSRISQIRTAHYQKIKFQRSTLRPHPHLLFLHIFLPFTICFFVFF